MISALAEPLLRDPDPYLRLAALDLIVVSSDKEFRANALQQLARDEEEFVKAAALHALATH